MPPKVYKKPVREQGLQKSASQLNNQKLPLTQKWDINIRNVAQNSQVMERVHTLTSILAGAVAGLFNAGLYSGVFAYVALHLIIVFLIAGSLKKIDQYFVKSTDLLGGLSSGIMVFLCTWIITYNVVYTL